VDEFEPLLPDTTEAAAALSAEAVEEAARLDRIAERLLLAFASDPEYQEGDTVFALLECDRAVGGRYVGYGTEEDALMSLSMHLTDMAGHVGFRMLAVPVAGG